MSSVKRAESKPERNFANCILRRRQLFAIQRMVTLGKTNAQGGAYFAEFFAWSGEAREEMLAACGPFEGITLHTSEARMKFFRELRPFEKFEIVVWPCAGRASLSVRFFFLRGGELIAIGDQEIAFKSQGKLTALPDAFVSAVDRFDPE